MSTTASSDRAEFRGVPPLKIDALMEVYPAVRRLMEEALERQGDYDFAGDFLPDIRKGLLQMWVGVAAGKVGLVVVTRIEDRPKNKVGQILVCTGENRAYWLRHLSTIEDWFQAQGCARVEAWARSGWARDLTDYRKTHVMLEKALGPCPQRLLQ